MHVLIDSCYRDMGCNSLRRGSMTDININLVVINLANFLCFEDDKVVASRH